MMKIKMTTKKTQPRSLKNWKEIDCVKRQVQVLLSLKARKMRKKLKRKKKQKTNRFSKKWMRKANKSKLEAA